MEAVAELAPRAATLVIFHSAVLAYLDPAARSTFVATVQHLPGYWIANEAPTVIVPTANLPPSPDLTKALFVLALDGEPVAYAGAHGQSLHWFG